MQLSFTGEQLDSLFPYYICLDAAGQIQAYSSAIRQLAGNIDNGPLWDLFHCETADSHTPIHHLSETQPQQHLLLKLKRDSNISLPGRFVPIGNENQLLFVSGQVTTVVLDAHETSYQEMQELAMEENANLLKMAVEAAKAGLWAYDSTTGAFNISEEFKKMVQLLPGQPLTLEIMGEKVHPEDMLRLYDNIFPALTIKCPEFLFEVRVRVNDSYRYFEAKGNCIRFTPDGLPGKLVGTLRDTTEEREKLQQAIRNEHHAQLQEQRMKNYMDISSDGIFEADLEGNLIFFNRAMLKILQHKGRKNPNLCDYVDSSNKEQFREDIRILLQTGKKQHGLFTLKQSGNQEVRYIEYYITVPVTNEKESFSGRITDVTEVVMKEKILNEAIDREARLEQSKTLFIHTTSHELRTPLTIIQSNAEILKMCLEFPEFQKKKDPMTLIDRITRSVGSMTEILSQLLMISRIENGTIEPEISVVNLPSFINEVVEQFTPYNDGRNLKVTLKDTPAEWVFDPKIMRFALANLLSNAFRYSPHKEPPELLVCVKNKKLQFQVKDYGIGIRADEIDKLYRSFFRGSNVGKISGTGIGLMVVEYATHSHGGAITLKTELEKGSTFTLSLPNTPP